MNVSLITSWGWQISKIVSIFLFNVIALADKFQDNNLTDGSSNGSESDSEFDEYNKTLLESSSI